MYKQVLLTIFVALPLVVNCSRPTHCERWKGDSEFRCGKNGYRADNIRIRNIGDSVVGFKIGKSLSQCGHSSVSYFDRTYSLPPRDSMKEAFSEVKTDSCNEFFVYDCTRYNNRVDCLDVISVCPV